MTLLRSFSMTVLAVTVLVLGVAAPFAAPAQKDNPAADQLPQDLKGAKIYHLPDPSETGKPAENPVIYRNISYGDINFDRLLLNLSLGIKPLDRSATIQRIYFQDVRAGGIPVHIATFDKEFKVSKKEGVDLPGPLQCSIVFTDLESFEPLKELVDKHQIRITGQSFIEVKLNSVEKVFTVGKPVVIPVKLDEEIPIQLLPDNPFMQMAAQKILETLADPSTSAAVALAKEHLAKLTQTQTLSSLGQSALYLIECEYVLVDPKTKAVEAYVESGTGFVVSADGKLLTAKRVVQPWKFDPQVAFLMKQHHLVLDENAYKLSAWPAGAQVLSVDGKPDSDTALSTQKQTLRLLKLAPDQMTKQDYRDATSGSSATLDLHAPGANDLAVLQITGSGFQPLAFADPGAIAAQNLKAALFSFPYGLSQPLALPKLSFVNVAPSGSIMTIDQPLNAGEPGAPLLTPDGKVIALAGERNECISAESLRSLIQ